LFSLASFLYLYEYFSLLEEELRFTKIKVIELEKLNIDLHSQLLSFNSTIIKLLEKAKLNMHMIH